MVFPDRHHDDEDGGGIPTTSCSSSSSSSSSFFSPALPSRFIIASPSSPFSLNVPSFSSSSFFHSFSLSNSPSSSSSSSAPPIFLLHNLLFSVHPSSSSSSSPTTSVSVSPLHPSAAAALLPGRHSFPAGRSHVCALLATYSFVVTAHRDHRVRVWRRPPADDGRLADLRYRLHGSLPSTIQKLLSAMSGSKSYVATERRRYDRLWLQHVDTISAMAADEDEICLYTASWDRSVKIWGLKRMACIQSIDRAHDDAVSSVAIAPAAGGSGDLLLTASADGYVKAWMKVGGFRRVLLWELAAHPGGAPALALEPGGDVLYTAGSADCSIRVWEQQRSAKSATIHRRHNNNNNLSRVNDGGAGGAGGGDDWRVTAELRGHRRAVLCLAVAGPLLCSGSADRSIRVWMRCRNSSAIGRTTTREEGIGGRMAAGYVCMAVLEGHEAAVRRLCISPELASRRRCLLCSAAVDGEIRLWSIFFSASSHSHSLREHLRLPENR